MSDIIIQIDLSQSFENAKTLFDGLADISEVSTDTLAPTINKKCVEILTLIGEVKSLLKQ